MPALTREQWAQARAEWENDPLCSYLTLSQKYHVDKSAISRRCNKEGWVKRAEHNVINAAALRRADRMSDPDGQRATSTLDPVAQQNAREESETKRAAVLVRHRSEWLELEGFRRVALAKMKAAHDAEEEALRDGTAKKAAAEIKEKWARAKLAAEAARTHIGALVQKQDSERAAWGLNEMVQETPTDMRAAFSFVSNLGVVKTS